MLLASQHHFHCAYAVRRKHSWKKQEKESNIEREREKQSLSGKRVRHIKWKSSNGWWWKCQIKSSQVQVYQVSLSAFQLVIQIISPDKRDISKLKAKRPCQNLPTTTVLLREKENLCTHTHTFGSIVRPFYTVGSQEYKSEHTFFTVLAVTLHRRTSKEEEDDD